MSRFTSLLATSLGALSVAGLLAADEVDPALDFAERSTLAALESVRTLDDATWCSQPGAIRVFDRPSGQLRTLHKLYSSPEPELEGTQLGRLSIDRPPPGDAAARFADVNFPVTAPDGSQQWPILDPRAEAEGFSFEPSADGNPLPLRVWWLYMTRDGTFGPLDDDGHFQPLFNPRTALPRPASSGNPIVSRVAWWTDDATCKINVNTASEGVFWDTPRCDTTEERAYALRQPATGEHQREMGHPAAVCLSSVLFPGRRYHLPGTSSSLPPLPLSDAKVLWRASRGISDAGTEGGTVSVDPHTQQLLPASSRARVDSLDQFAAKLPAALRAKVTQSAGLLTARSRGLETTERGVLPVGLWPVETSVARTSLDDIAPPAENRDVPRVHQQLVAAVSGPWLSGDEAPHLYRRGDRFHQMAESTRNQGAAWFIERALLESLPKFAYDDARAWPLSALGWIRGVDFRPSQAVPFPGHLSPLQGFTTESLTAWGSRFGSFRNFMGSGTMPTITEVALIITLRTQSLDGGPPAPYPIAKPAPALTGLALQEYEVGLLLECCAPCQAVQLGMPSMSVRLDTGFPSQTLPPSDAPATPTFVTLNGQRLVVQTSPTHAKTSVSTEDTPFTGWMPIGGVGGTRFVGILRFEPTLFILPGRGGARPSFITFGGTSLTTLPQPRLIVSIHPGGPITQVIPLGYPSFTLDGPTEPGPLDLGDRFHKARLSGQLFGDDGLIRPTDVVQSLVLNHGDVRVLAAKRVALQSPASNPGADWPTFVGVRGYGTTRQAHSLADPSLVVNRAAVPSRYDAQTYFGPAAFAHEMPPELWPDWLSPFTEGWIRCVLGPYERSVGNDAFPMGGREVNVPAAEAFEGTRLDRRPDGTYHRGADTPDVTGDFDTGLAAQPDGPWNNFPDAGDGRGYPDGTPYFDTLEAPWTRPDNLWSAHRQAPSAVMLGSLPSGVGSNVPWQTMLFRPDANKGTPAAHFGSTGVPDHRILGAFRMPVVEPAVFASDGLPGGAWTPSDFISTEGRINMNHAMLPFTHVRRATALHALFKAQKLLAIPNTAAAIYKTHAGDQTWRHHIDADETLRQWEQRHQADEVFQHASEICEQWLVPEGQSLEDMPAFWEAHRLTGDNVKERPYANIYPHLTTRSLTYELHAVVETLAKDPATAPDTFDPAVDRVTARRQYLRRITGGVDERLPAAAVDPRSPQFLPPADLVRWRSADPAAPPLTPRLTGIRRDEWGVPVISFVADPELPPTLEWSADLVTWVPLRTATPGLAYGAAAEDGSPGEALAQADPTMGEERLGVGEESSVPGDAGWFRLRYWRNE